MPQKMVRITDFLTEAQIQQCERLYPDRKAIRDQVIVPNMADINRKLEQENDPDYMAYLVMYVIGRAIQNRN